MLLYFTLLQDHCIYAGAILVHALLPSLVCYSTMWSQALQREGCSSMIVAMLPVVGDDSGLQSAACTVYLLGRLRHMLGTLCVSTDVLRVKAAHTCNVSTSDHVHLLGRDETGPQSAHHRHYQCMHRHILYQNPAHLKYCKVGQIVGGFQEACGLAASFAMPKHVRPRCNLRCMPLLPKSGVQLQRSMRRHVNRMMRLHITE